MEPVLLAIASRQPSGVDVTMSPTVTSVSALEVDVAYQLKGWLVNKHYHVTVNDRVSIILEHFQIRRSHASLGR